MVQPFTHGSQQKKLISNIPIQLQEAYPLYINEAQLTDLYLDLDFDSESACERFINIVMSALSDHYLRRPDIIRKVFNALSNAQINTIADKMLHIMKHDKVLCSMRDDLCVEPLKAAPNPGYSHFTTHQILEFWSYLLPHWNSEETQITLLLDYCHAHNISPYSERKTEHVTTVFWHALFPKLKQEKRNQMFEEISVEASDRRLDVFMSMFIHQEAVSQPLFRSMAHQKIEEEETHPANAMPVTPLRFVLLSLFYQWISYWLSIVMRVESTNHQRIFQNTSQSTYPAGITHTDVLVPTTRQPESHQPLIEASTATPIHPLLLIDKESLTHIYHWAKRQKAGWQLAVHAVFFNLAPQLGMTSFLSNPATFDAIARKALFESTSEYSDHIWQSLLAYLPHDQATRLHYILMMALSLPLSERSEQLFKFIKSIDSVSFSDDELKSLRKALLQSLNTITAAQLSLVNPICLSLERLLKNVDSNEVDSILMSSKSIDDNHNKAAFPRMMLSLIPYLGTTEYLSAAFKICIDHIFSSKQDQAYLFPDTFFLFGLTRLISNLTPEQDKLALKVFLSVKKRTIATNFHFSGKADDSYPDLFQRDTDRGLTINIKKLLEYSIEQLMIKIEQKNPDEASQLWENDISPLTEDASGVMRRVEAKLFTNYACYGLFSGKKSTHPGNADYDPLVNIFSDIYGKTGLR